MICEKCGNEMNTVYQHELQNISGVMPHEHNGSFNFVVSNIYGYVLHRQS